MAFPVGDAAAERVGGFQIGGHWVGELWVTVISCACAVHLGRCLGFSVSSSAHRMQGMVVVSREVLTAPSCLSGDPNTLPVNRHCPWWRRCLHGSSCGTSMGIFFLTPHLY